MLLLGVKNGQPKITEDSNEKTILVVGATGSGKSTLIDAMINHIVDVSFRDECRFKTVDLTTKEETSKDKQVCTCLYMHILLILNLSKALIFLS